MNYRREAPEVSETNQGRSTRRFTKKQKKDPDAWIPRNSATKAMYAAITSEPGDAKGLLVFLALCRFAALSKHLDHVQAGELVDPTTTHTLILSDRSVLGACFAGLGTLARATGLSVAGVRRGVAWGESVRWIDVVNRENGASCLYRLHYTEVKRWQEAHERHEAVTADAGTTRRRESAETQARGKHGRFSSGAESSPQTTVNSTADHGQIENFPHRRPRSTFTADHGHPDRVVDIKAEIGLEKTRKYLGHQRQRRDLDISGRPEAGREEDC